MPCPADAIVKGDSKEYCIAAASILAKVTRDRIMHQYDTMYPDYIFGQHKGYPTAAHVHAISVYGPCPIHRLTFAPLKTKVTVKKRKHKER
jgi:ribonuclease HII